VITVSGPGRCTRCSHYVANQGHRDGCDATTVTPGVADFGVWPVTDFIGEVHAEQEARKVFTEPVNRKRQCEGSPHARLRGVAGKVANTPDGQRHRFIYWGARKMRELVDDGTLTIREVCDELYDAAVKNEYVRTDGQSKTLGHIASGLGVSKADLR
jgi:hypothetical protein